MGTDAVSSSGLDAASTVGTDAARVQRALELAYRYVSRRERTVAELSGHLAARGIPPECVEPALVQLRELGVLDDARYARAFSEDKRELEGWGSERIRRKLLERGVERELVERALASERAGSERDRALALLRRRFPAGLTGARERERALGLLVRRGYDSELAYDTVRAWDRIAWRGGVAAGGEEPPPAGA